MASEGIPFHVAFIGNTLTVDYRNMGTHQQGYVHTVILGGLVLQLRFLRIEAQWQIEPGNRRFTAGDAKWIERGVVVAVPRGEFVTWPPAASMTTDETVAFAYRYNSDTPDGRPPS